MTMTNNMLPYLAARVMGTPLMIEPSRLDVILSVVGSRFGLETAITAVAQPFEHKRASLVVTSDGIAIIPIRGTLTKRADSINAMSGMTSYGVIEDQIFNAATDGDVQAILLDIDSPGGEVGGVFDLATLILEAKEMKPIWAVADSAFSSAYLLASTADRIFLSSTSGVGSIGVIATHIDESEKDAKEGSRYTTIFAGSHKGDLSSHAPLSSQARTTVQAEIDRIYEMFVSVVAINRNLSVDAVKATEAALYFGPNAIEIGLADNVGNLRDALAELSAELKEKQDSPINNLLQEKRLMPDSKLPDSKLTSTALAATDLSAIKDQMRTELLAEAGGINDLCTLAGFPLMAGGLIASGVGIEQVRQTLLTKQASAQEQEIRNHVLPGDGTWTQASTGISQIERAAMKLAGKGA